MIRRFLAGFALALVACSPQAKDATVPTGVHSESGLRVIPLTIEHDGRKLPFRVEVAATMEEQEKGLMFRTAMGADEGMIFPMSPPRQASFWMKNTVIPLDLIFVAPDGRIANISANAVPYDLTPRLSAGLVKGVLELKGGRAAELGVVAGDRVEW